ncbi:MAG: DUF456 domain-containing protein [Anaerolineales bacterium]|jgi:uncharacterized protein YqgC (DUF456 family)
MSDVLITILAGFLMLVGLLGTVLPVLPDLPLVWVAALGYGLIVGWGEHGLLLFGVISVLGVIGILSEIWVSGAGARRGGASILSTLGGIALGVAGLLVAGPIGLVVGMLAGTFILEYVRHQDVDKALRATLGIGLGYGVSIVVKFMLGLAMIAVWIVWLFVR